jgi:hypothetical protein
LPFERIKQMAARDDLPRRLLSCVTPKCSACLYGKPTRRPWRTKEPVNKFRAPEEKKPGDVVAVDQLISNVPGLIGQMRGFLTRKRYTVTTVFVDHFSGLSYVALQQSTSALETIASKQAFERFAESHGALCSQCTSSKWASREEDTRPTRSSMNHDHAC